ncbi:MAG: mechanosensitive ion channel [Candidatus Aenigmarchaeota archaeon]|nr:mechanosensitive ion channel [Candidatus Aenigmarchaeota archaeon]
MALEIGAISLERITLFVFAVLVTAVGGNVAYSLILKYLETRHVKFWGAYLLAKMLLYSTYVVGIGYGITYVLAFNVSELVASLGLLGIVIASGAMPMIQNYYSGFLIILDRPFREKDYVEFNGTVCKVINIGLRRTQMRAVDGRIFIVPNTMFFSSPVINYTQGEYLKTTLEVPIAHDADMEKARAVIMEICVENSNIVPKVSKHMSVLEALLSLPKDIKKLEPKILIKSMDKDRTVLEVWFWIQNINRRDAICSEVLWRVKERFKEEGIKLG